MTAAPPSVPASGTWIDGYEILGELGRGGMGVVLLVRDTALGRFAALKLMRKERVASPEALERFRREARALAQLNHPGIVTVYGVGESPAGPYIAMEYVSGTSLSALLERAVDKAEWVEAVTQAADALAHAHREGVVHRDVKPANLLLTHRQDGSVRVRLVDFGLAALLGGESAVTLPGAFVGTPAYTAPEQAAGARVDGRADAYSLAVVALHGLTPARLARPVRSGAVAQAAELEAALDQPSGLAPAVAQVLARGLSQAPEHRFPSVDVFAAALGAATGALPLHSDAADAKRLEGNHDLPARDARGFHAVLRARVASVEHARATVAAVARHGGIVLAALEGEVVGLFGGATGALQPAEAAVHAALACAAAGAEVVVGAGAAQVASEHQRVVAAAGPAFDDARRLQAAAPQDAAHHGAARASRVMISATVHARTLGAVFTEPAGAAFRVLSVGHARNLGDPGFLGVPLPFVGRAEPLARTLEAIDRQGTERALVLLAGPVGAGRTRLLREVGAALDARADVVVLDTARVTSPAGFLGALAGMVAERAGVTADEPEAVLRLKLEAALRRAGARATESLLDALAATVGAASPGVNVVAAVTDYWRCLAAVHPVVVLIDDLDRGGPDALAFARHVSGGLVGARVTVVATTAAPLDLPATRVTVPPLGAPALAELARHALAAAPPVDSPRLDALVRGADGLPQVLLQRLFDLVDRGALTPATPNWSLDLQAWDDALGADPPQVDLPERARLTLEAAALAADSVDSEGPEPIWPGLLDAMTDGDADVNALVERGLLAVRGEQRLDDQPDLVFQAPHLLPLLRESMTPGRARELHARAAGWLAQRTQRAPSLAAAVARHWEASGEVDLALDAARRAAHRAQHAGAPAAAAQLYEHAARLTETLKAPVPELWTLAAEQHVLAGQLERAVSLATPERPQLAVARGRALERLGRFDEATEAYASAPHALPARIALAALDAKRGRPEAALASLVPLCAALDPDFEAASAGGAEPALADPAAEPTNERLASEAHRQRGNALIRLQRLAEAEDALSRARELAEDAADLGLELDALNGLGAARYYAGHLDDARRDFDAALELARRGRFLQHEALILNNLGEIQLALGDVRAADETLDRALQLWRGLGSDEGIADSARLASRVSELLHRTNAAALAREAVHAARRTGAGPVVAAAEAQLEAVLNAPTEG